MRCQSSHLPSWAGRNQMPRLAKQRIDYLIHSMKSFRDNTTVRSRYSDESNAVAGNRSRPRLGAAAHYACYLTRGIARSRPPEPMRIWTIIGRFQRGTANQVRDTP